jgi:hypothetical protein
MTNQEKSTIENMREDGFSYGQIAAKSGVSVNTVKSFCRREDEKKHLCRNCGKSLVQIPKHKPRVFCSSECRLFWWRLNRKQGGHRAVYHITCVGCGRDF